MGHEAGIEAWAKGRRAAELESEVATARAERDAALAAVTAATRETCREWSAEMTNRCSKPAEFILWGKLFPADALGPRCYNHALTYLHDMSAHTISQTAVFDLRPLLRLGTVGQDVCPHCESTGRCVGSCLDDPREDPGPERCACGHAASSHTSLGYCRARSKRDGECPCPVGQAREDPNGE